MKLYGILWHAEVGGFAGITIVSGKRKAKKVAKASGDLFSIIGPLEEGKETSFLSGVVQPV